MLIYYIYMVTCASEFVCGRNNLHSKVHLLVFWRFQSHLTVFRKWNRCPVDSSEKASNWTFGFCSSLFPRSRMNFHAQMIINSFTDTAGSLKLLILVSLIKSVNKRLFVKSRHCGHSALQYERLSKPNHVGVSLQISAVK